MWQVLLDSIAVITARGGSKRIPGKNIKAFLGKPIIAYSIETARKSNLFNRIIVSTDSEEIAAVARSWGAEVPFIRPANISDDYTPTADVVLHAVNWLQSNGANARYVCCLYPTAPFITVEDLQKGYELLEKNHVTGSFSVTTFPHPVFRGLKMNSQGRLEMLWPEYELTRSNDLPEVVHDIGQFYWREISAFKKDKKIWAPDAMPVMIPRKRAQDIDTPEDWERAEALYKVLYAV